MNGLKTVRTFNLVQYGAYNTEMRDKLNLETDHPHILGVKKFCKSLPDVEKTCKKVQKCGRDEKHPKKLPYYGTWRKRKTRKTTLHWLHDAFCN